MSEPALYARMELRIKDFERQLQRAEARAEQGTARIGRSADRAAKQVESRVSGMAGRLNTALVGAFAGVATAQGARQLIDTSTRITNALRVTGLRGEALEATYANLRNAALENYGPFEALVQLYSRVALSQKELGVSTQSLTDFSRNIAVILRASGVSAREASGALLQLSQALGAGIVRAEEWNSIQEGAPGILQAAAAGIEEAGGSVAKLRQIMLDGELSSRAFFEGIQAGTVVIAQRLKGSVAPLSQGFENLQTILIDAAKEFNDNARAADHVNWALDKLGGGLIQFGRDLVSLIEEVRGIIQWFTDLGDAASAAGDKIRASLNFDPRPPSGTRLTVTNPEIVPAPQRAGSSRRGGAPMAPRRTVSLADFDPPGSGGGGGGGGRTGRSGQDSYQRLTEMIRERTRAVEAETAAQAGLNPLIDDYGFALEKARAKHDLLTAAQEAGLAINPALEGQIDTLATAYATASVEAERLAVQQEDLRERARELSDTAKDSLRGFISDLRSGKSWADSLVSAIERIGDRLADFALDSLFAPSGSGAGGLLGALFGGIAGARARGGPMTPGRSYLVGERGPELVTPRFGGNVVSNRDLSQMRRGGGNSLNFAPITHIDAAGSNVSREEIDAMLASRDRTLMREVKRIVPGVVADDRARFR